MFCNILQRIYKYTRKIVRRQDVTMSVYNNTSIIARLYGTFKTVVGKKNS